jgi:hypothetical protein
MAWPRTTTSPRYGERLACRDEYLLADDVDPGDRLRDRVLDLYARVHLEEVVRAVRVEKTLDRSRRPVADRTRGVDRDCTDPRTELRVDGWGRRLLDELLMASLDRAVALSEMHDVAVRVGEDLHLDVAGVVEIALDVHGGVREIRLALAPRRFERALDIPLAVRERRPFPPPPADAFTAIG